MASNLGTATSVYRQVTLTCLDPRPPHLCSGSRTCITASTRRFLHQLGHHGVSAPKPFCTLLYGDRAGSLQITFLLSQVTPSQVLLAGVLEGAAELEGKK